MSKTQKYLVVSSLTIIMAISILPRLGLAQTTVEQIQAQINALMSQIQQLQTQLAQIQGGTTQWCHTFNVNLKVGDNGNEVIHLVTALGKESFSVSNSGSNFDESLASAVSGFQQKYADEILIPLSLKYGTGFVGAATRAKLNKLYGCGDNVTPPPFACTQIACASNQRTICPAGLDDKGCPLPCKCVPPVECAEPICQLGYTRYNTNEKDIYSCPIIKCFPPTSNQPPVISGVSGPTALKLNEIGTWTIKASDPEQGVLTYQVFWGDEAANASAQLSMPSTYTQTATLTHTYNRAGIYNPTFTVTDSQGLFAKTSISVNVEMSSACVSEGGSLGAVYPGNNLQCCVGLVAQIPAGIVGTRGTCVKPASITVLSPNGGESYNIGDKAIIKWSSTGVDKVYINWLQDRDGNGTYEYVYGLFGSTAQSPSGSIEWVIPNNMFSLSSVSSRNKISVSTYVGTIAVKDESDAPFSIVAVGAMSQPDTASQMANTLESARLILNQMLESLKNQ